MIFLQNNLWWWLCRKIRCTVLTGVRKQLLLGWILRTAWWNLIYTVAELLSMGHGKWGKKHLFKKQTSSYNYTISGYKIILWIWFTAGNDLGIKNNPFTKGVNSKHDLSKIVDVFSEVLGELSITMLQFKWTHYLCFWCLEICILKWLSMKSIELFFLFTAVCYRGNWFVRVLHFPLLKLGSASTPATWTGHRKTKVNFIICCIKI